MARIVVIEDEAGLRGVLEYNLQRGGHDVQSAGTGAEGARMVEESLPDLVPLDLILPDLSGECASIGRRGVASRRGASCFATSGALDGDANRGHAWEAIAKEAWAGWNLRGDGAWGGVSVCREMTREGAVPRELSPQRVDIT